MAIQNLTKEDVLYYLRNRAEELYSNLTKEFSRQEYKKLASKINQEIKKSADNYKKTRIQKISNRNTIEDVLMISYSSYIVMLEYRNKAWEYNNMDFSRRVGEFWEPFCKLCFEYALYELQFFTPPLFVDVKKNLQYEIMDYINNLSLPQSEKNILLNYYNKVWSLITSGEIKLELDLHIKNSKFFYNIDFKSGFNSNEKGNTNRLLLVGSIYKNIVEKKHKCCLFIRSEDNNHYLQTLANSGIWDVFIGKKAYGEIISLTGFDLESWIRDNINWTEDIEKNTKSIFHKNGLMRYLEW